MNSAVTGVAQSRIGTLAQQVALGAIMLLPLLLLHAHGIAEAAIAVADICFLVHCSVTRQWDWLRAPWCRVAGAWWLWVVICSTPIPGLHTGEGGRGSLIQAIAMIRFLLLAACLENLVLRPAAARRWLLNLIMASTAWIALNAFIQNFTGRNLLGWPRSAEGELTGPFGTPRAGPAIARILIPSILPPVADLLQRHRPRTTACAYLVLLIAVLVMVLIGQRMPLVIAVMGLVVAAFLLPKLRPVVLVAAIAGGLLIAASPIVAPSAYFRLVQKFSNQLEHFAVSPYGLLYARAWAVGSQNPITGMGFDGFETGCPRPEYFRPTFDGTYKDGAGAFFCWDHPHNFYFQALDDGGFIGLALFAALAVTWLVTLGRGLWRDPDPLRVALFAAAFIQLWPIQSTTAFNSMPIGGWFFLLLGFGLAETRWRLTPPLPA
jgi:O-antigen ligase